MAGKTEGEKFSGWRADKFGRLTLSITIGREDIRPATVTYDAATGLYERYIGLPLAGNELGQINGSRERAVRKAEDFLIDKLRRLP